MAAKFRSMCKQSFLQRGHAASFTKARPLMLAPRARCKCNIRAEAQHTAVQGQQRSAAAKAAIFTGTYAIAAGLALTLAPATTFGLLFNVAEVTIGWIRVGGILFSLIGLQYLGTGLGDKGQGTGDSFYRATVWSRLMLAAGFAIVVAMGEAPRTLLVLAALNVAGALSMALALRAGPAGGGQKTSKSASKADVADGLDGINDCNPLGM